MRVAVEPVSPDVAVPPHPIDGPMDPAGMEWTADQFTFRLIQEGTIRRKDDQDPAPVKPPVPTDPAPAGGAKPIPQTAVAKPVVAAPVLEKV